MTGLSCPAVNAPMGPSLRLNGLAAAMMSACNFRISGVGFAQMPAMPRPPPVGTAMKLDAFKRYYIPTGGGLGVAGICAKPTPEILKLQADIIAAASPFNLRDGPIGAFTAGHDNPVMDKAIIGYVSKFEQIGAGEHFNPHVSTGTATTAYLDQMNAEPFEPFTFSPAGAAVYQLGPFGTAAKRLKQFDLKP